MTQRNIKLTKKEVLQELEIINSLNGGLLALKSLFLRRDYCEEVKDGIIQYLDDYIRHNKANVYLLKKTALIQKMDINSPVFNGKKNIKDIIYFPV